MNFCSSSGLVCWMSSEVEQHVVGHLEREIDLQHLLARGGVGRVAGVEAFDPVAERRAVDLDEDQAEPVGDVLHQGGLAVAGRRHQEQQAHLVDPFAFAQAAQLLRQVGADQRQVDLLDQLVAHEGAHHLGLQLAEAQPFPGLAEQAVADLLVAPETGHRVVAEVGQPGQELVEPQFHLPFGDPVVLAEQAFDQLGRRGVRGLPFELALGEQQYRGLLEAGRHLALAAPALPLSSSR